MTELEPINLVWLKRDLRLTDHAPLADAAARPEPLSLIYCFEPELLNDPHYDERHWRFIWQSLMERMMFDLAYPEPIVDLTEAARAARERLWGWRNRVEVKREGQRVLGRHVRPS